MISFKLEKTDKNLLKKMIRSGMAGHEVVRAMTLILRDKGDTRSEVADTLDITPRTVTNTCSNYDNYALKDL